MLVFNVLASMHCSKQFGQVPKKKRGTEAKNLDLESESGFHRPKARLSHATPHPNDTSAVT